MRSEELIRMLQSHARANGLSFSVVHRRGKGSHVMVCLGDSRSFLPRSRDLPIGTRDAVLHQLGVSMGDLRSVRRSRRPEGH